jgi:hypothetical protein
VVVFFKSIVTTAILTGAVAASATVAAASPGVSSQHVRPTPAVAQDLRSPDARDAALRATTQDLRSPDARDAALRSVAPSTAAVQAPVRDSADASSNDFPWLESAIIAVVALSVVGVVAQTMRRRHRLAAGV